MNKLRSIFNPSTQKLITQYENMLDIHTSNIGKCSTCKHHILPPTDLPGFVTDYGECNLRKDIFSSKVCGLKDVTCDGYEENREVVEHLKREINRFKEESRDE